MLSSEVQLHFIFPESLALFHISLLTTSIYIFLLFSMLTYPEGYMMNHHKHLSEDVIVVPAAGCPTGSLPSTVSMHEDLSQMKTVT